MTMKSDTHVGVHCFEAAGLGKAPFRFTGYEYKTYQAAPGAPVQPGDVCHYCGQAIMNVCHIISSDGKRSHVGPDCIRKVGDEGVYKAYKRSPEYRQRQREIRRAKAQRGREEIHLMLQDEMTVEALKSVAHPYGFKDRKTGEPMTGLDYVEWMLSHSGNDKVESLKKYILKRMVG